MMHSNFPMTIFLKIQTATSGCHLHKRRLTGKNFCQCCCLVSRFIKSIRSSVRLPGMLCHKWAMSRWILTWKRLLIWSALRRSWRITLVIPYQDSDLEKSYIFYRHLSPKLPRRQSGLGYNFDDEIRLEYYRLQKISEGSISLSKSMLGNWSLERK